MKNSKEQIDDLIRESLSKEEAKFYDELEEQSLMHKMFQVHKGKTGWLASIMTVIHIVAFIIFVYCVMQFLNAEQANELIKWSAAGFLCLVIMGMLKLYVWMQMDKNDILRELKRLELQLATLMARLEK